MHPEYTFANNYFTLDGHRLHYVDEGQGPVIVLLHGNPTWSFYYRKVIRDLRLRFRVIAPDHMGCGLSDKPQHYDYTLKRHIDNIEKLLESLKVQKFSLMVHDWGGAIGMGCAGRSPGRVEKIILLNTAAFRSRRIPFRIALCRCPFAGEFLVRACNGFAWPATFMAVEKPMERSIRELYLMPYDSWKNRIAIWKFVRDIPLHPRHPSYETLVDVERGLEDIRREKIPVLILWGDRDFCFDREFYRQWGELFPEAERHLFREYGHYVLEDGYDELKTHIDRFLADEHHGPAQPR